MDNKKCWCYLTYVFPMDEMPPVPFPKIEGQQIPAKTPPSIEPSSLFEPSWFFNSKFPEDE